MLITNGLFVLKATTILYILYLNTHIIGSSYIFSELQWVKTPKFSAKIHVYNNSRERLILWQAMTT